VRTARFEDEVKNIDVVIDTVGGDTLDRSLEVLKPRGVLVSAVATPDQDKAARYHVRGVWFLVTVTSYGLAKIADLIDSGQLSVNVGCREKNPLKDTYERDRDTLVTDTIEGLLKKIERESLLTKADRLFQICRPPSGFNKMEDYRFDRDRLKQIDDARHAIVHHIDSVQTSVRDDIRYMEQTARKYACASRMSCSFSDVSGLLHINCN
jgi:hypothetical protein